MSKESTEMRHLMRNPKAFMDFKLYGKTPEAVKPSSPLITYLESIPPRERVRITNVKLSPKLGYQSGAAFSNAQQLLQYLKPSAYIVGSWPAESCRIKSFTTRITDDIFRNAQ